MAGNYTIDVSVVLRTQQANIKNLRKKIEEEFSEVDFNSSIGKKLNSLFSQFDTKISDMDSILGKGVLNTSDLNRLGTIFDRIGLIIGQMRSNVGKAPLLDLGIDPSEIPELVAAVQELKKLQADQNKARQKSTKDRLTETKQEELLNKVRSLQDTTEVSEDKSLAENTKALEKELQKRQALLEEYESRSVELEAEKQHKLSEQQQKQSMSKKALEDAWKMERDAHGKAAIEKTPIRKLGTRADAQTFQQQKQNIQNFVGQVFDEAIVDFGSTMESGSLTHALLSSLFSPDEIQSMAEYTSDQFKQAFEEKLFKQDGKAINQDNLKKFMGSAEDWVRANSMTSAQMSAQGNALRASATTYQNEAMQAGIEAQGADTEFQNNEVLIQSLHTQIATFSAIVSELAQATAEFNQSVNALYKDAIKGKNDEIEQIGQNKRNENFPSVQPGNPALTRQYTDEALNNINATKDAETFQNNLKSTISQWMGAREIIGYVKQGIREAYQDIQGLDKAMTNIAVVTDMSVSDLWGKIDEYMGVAQQYGVTTQGVYEVSQLYFQQGLSEADTMAATTETLKMARIAGMDYAEAADGMTVAIRGFNMEMQDAAHVTDVYSKVAAITASDTQELVTAMSKTASSAAAVGSSFENTTAMLAVMIEATRESPQNLGSALKSIISRYGEMTKGLSEDSEGEQIDYNRVDAALKTVGISLKDAQGQFRDFDTVIEELSAKWDTLDSVTQRYIATIFAGNRQQSRFLALVSNYDRYMEVSEAAANSEDAGLLQYSKTLDSLETKLNNISTSFQQFYMGIFNGPTVGAILDFINNLIKGLNKLSKFTAILNLGSIINGIKTAANLLIKPFSSIGTEIAKGIQEGFDRAIAAAPGNGQKIADGAKQGANTELTHTQKINKKYGGLIKAGSIIGGGLSFIGSRVAEENQGAGAWISGIGNTVSYAAMGAQIAGVYGAIGGALIGIVSTISSLPSDLEKAQNKLEKASEKSEEANIERAQATERARNLKSTLDNLKKLEKARYESEEASQAYIDASNAAFEQFPELAASFDAVGNAIINAAESEWLLVSARQEAAAATTAAASAELIRAQSQKNVNSEEKIIDFSDNIIATIADSWVLQLSHQDQRNLYFDENGNYKAADNTSYYGVAPGGTTEESKQRYLKMVATTQVIEDQLGFSSNLETAQFLAEVGQTSWENEAVQLATLFNLDENSLINAGLPSYEELEEITIADFLPQLREAASKGNLFTQSGRRLESSNIDKILQAYFAQNDANISYEEILRNANTLYSESEAYGHMIESAQKTLINSYVSETINGAYNPTGETEGVFSIDGFSEALQRNVLEALTSEEGYAIEDNLNTNLFDSSTGEILEEAKTKAQEYAIQQYDAFRQLYEVGLQDSEEKVADYNDLISQAQAGYLTPEEYSSQLQELLNVGEDSPIFQTALTQFDSFKKERDEAVKRAQSQLLNQDRWGQVLEHIEIGIPTSYIDGILAQTVKLEKQAQAGEIPSDAANEIANTQAELLSQIMSIEDYDQRMKALSIYSEGDLSTTLGLQDMQEQFDTENLELNAFGIKTYAENLITQYGSLQEKLISGLENTTKVLQGASEGTNLEDASAIAKKVGKELGELFNFQDGQYFAKDANALKEIYKAYNKDLTENLDNTLAEQLNILTNQQYDFKLDQDGQIIQESIRPNQEYLDLMEQYGELAESWFQKLEDPTTEGLTTDSSLTEKVKAYLTDYSEDVATAIEEEAQWQFEQAEKALKINNRTHELESAGVGMDKREAFSLLSSKGKTGYSANEIAQLETYLGLGEDGLGAIETGIGTGEYEIDTSILRNLPIWVQNAINGIIEETMVDASESISDLGSQVSQLGGPDKGAMATAFVKTANEFGRELIEEEYPKRIQEAAEGDQTSQDILKHSIARELGKDFDSPEVQEAYRNLISSYNDGIVEAQKEIIDLKFKAIEGTLTSQEKDLLTDAGVDISAFISDIENATQGLIQEIISNAKLTFEEKVEYATKGYQAKFDQEFGKETDIAKTLAETESWDRSTAESFLGELSALTKIDYNVRDWFAERADGTFELIKSEAQLNTELNNITDDNVRQQIKDSYNFLKGWHKQTKKESALSELEGLATQSEFTASEIRDFYSEQLNQVIDVTTAEGIATRLEALDPMTRLNEWITMYQNVGITIDQDKYQQLVSLVLDSIIETISSGLSQLSSGIDGTLSFSDFTALQQKYGLSGRGATQSSRGVTLGKEDQQTLISELYKVAEKQGLEGEFGDQLWQTWLDSEDSAIEGYTDIEDAIKNCYDEQGNLVGVTEEYVKALQQARHSAMFDENAVEFAFMEQDATGGLTKSFDKFVDNIDKVKGALEGFRDTGEMAYNDFFNIVEYLGNSGQWEQVATNMGLAEKFIKDYNQFAIEAASATETIGKIDAKSMAAVGVDISTAATEMADGMNKGLKETARSQIRYLSGIEQMLLALQALEGIGDISLDLGISFESSIDGPVDLTLANISKYWQEIMNLGDADLNAKIDISIDNKLKELGTGGFNNFFKNLGFGENFDFITAFFGPDGFTFGSQTETQLASQLGQFASLTKTLTENQWITLAQDMQSIFESRMKFDPETGLFSVFELGEGGLEALVADMNKFLANYNFADIKESLNTALSQKMASEGKTEIPLETSSFTLKAEGNGFKIEGLTAENLLDPKIKESLMKDLSDYLGQLVTDIKLNEDGTINIFGENGLINTSGMKKINTDFQTAAEATSTLQTAITQISTVASSFQAGDQFQALAEQLRAGAAAARELMSAFTGQEIQPPDVTALETELAAARAAFDALAATSVPTSELDTARQRVTDIQTQLNSLQAPTGVTSGLIGELTNAIDIANRLSDALASNNGTPLEVNFNADDANSQVTVLIASLLQLNDVFKPTIEIEDKASNILESIIQLITNISSKTVTITTVHKDVYATVSSSGNGGISDKGGKDDSGPGPFAGTMNGLAFADGSLGRLHSGAILANKALVGELGPELAVYDGQYHMLGANGAEFVDLPSDAIIFNHLQTQGILRGQMNIRGTAMAKGNVTGPAFAGGGIGAALSAVRRAKSVWQGLLNSLSAADLMGAGGGGGGGGGDESLKAHIADLQEWYNLSRQIADIEGQINVLLAKRKNLTDGHEYLKNLRETQRLLDDQVNTQQDLLRFQQLQLQRQAEHINTNKIWSQFLEVDENGLLQYKEGNETNGGKGALEVLQQMNEMSGEEQTAFLAKLGYSYTDNDGNVLEGSELVAKFYEELQKQIDDYDALRDTVQEAESALEDLEAEIAEIEREIRDNEIDLSQEIYDIIVDAWKENIENLKEQNDLIKEANEAYANGIQEAIDAERQIYDQNMAISDREQLQRQLALMRRSGGSASEIADLEQQLDDMLKEEYFSNQEKQLETIQKANERQVELMDQQVKLQEEALEYQKENGVIWTKVYEVMQGTDAEILDFMQGNKTDFFEQSALQQEDMLTEWAKKIGIYTEERQRQNYTTEAAKTFNSAWETKQGKDLKAGFDKADSKQQEKWKREYNDTYASKRLEGKTHEEASALAQKELYEHIQNWLKAEEDKKKQNNSSNNSSNNSNTEQHGTRIVWQAYGKKDSKGQRKWGPRNTNSREGARQGFKSQYGFFPVGVDERIEKYAKGGIIDKTGLIQVDGSKSKPERILSAEQNRILEEGLAMNAGRSDKLKDMFTDFATHLGSSIRETIANITNNTSDSVITIQSGAVQLNIEQLNDSYDVDELFNDVADKLYSIAARSSGRSVKRR